MMICKADFEELFPHIFHPDHAPAAQGKPKSPGRECIARWEDDGGQSLPANRQHRAAPRHRPQYGHDMRTLAQAGAMAATMPAAAAYAAACNMLSAYQR